MGRHKGQMPWNKGLTISDLRVQKYVYKRMRRVTKICKVCNNPFEIKLSASRYRKHCSLKCRDLARIGRSPSNKGVAVNEKTKRKISIKLRKIAKEKGFGKWMLGKKHSKVTIQKMSESQRALKKSHPRWKGGITPLKVAIRNTLEFKEWRKCIFERDDYRCQECYKRGIKLNAHHEKAFSILLKEFLQQYDQFSPIDDKETLLRLATKWKPFWGITNGKTLCEDCHNKTKNRWINV